MACIPDTGDDNVIKETPGRKQGYSFLLLFSVGKIPPERDADDNDHAIMDAVLSCLMFI